MKRIVIRLFLAVLLVAALFFGAAGWITGTEAGLSWLVRQAEYQLPGKLTIKRVQGRLLDSFSIKGLVYVQDAADEPDGGIDGLPPQETRIAAASLAFVWRPAELLNGKLYIEKLHVHGLDAQLPKGRAEKTKDAPPAAPPQFPELPVEIVLDDVQIKSLNIKQPPIIIDSVELRATAGDTLAISRLRVESPLFTAAADGSLQLQTTPHPVQLNLNYSVDLPVAPGEGPEAKKTPGIVKISGQGVLSGDMRELTLETLRNDLLQGVLTVTGKASLQPSLAASLQLNADNLVLTELWPDWPGGLHLNAELTAAFTEKDFDIFGLALKIPETETALLFAGKGSLAEPADADAEKPRFHGALTWENVQWPLFSAADEKSVAKSAKGRIDLEGAPEAYRLALDADISGRDIPAGNWRAAGQGDSGGFKLSGLDADILQGALHLRGELDWSPVWRWDLALAGKDINPGAHWREWPGKLSLDIRSQGGSQEGVLTAQADIQEVQGKLRGYPLKFHAQTDMQGSRYQVKNLEFRSGSARLTADGSFAEKLAFDWAVRAPNLAALLPGVQGGIDAKGSIKGPPALPEVELRINAKSLAFDNNRLAALRADAAFDLGKSQKFRLNLLATDYRQDKKRVLKSLRLQGRGRMTAHTLTAELKTAKEQLSLLLKGGLAQARWQGALETLTANSPDFGKWKLSSPAALDLSSTKIRLDRACLRAVSKKGGQLCAELKREADTSVRASLKNVPLSLAKPFMPPDSKITGSLEGDLAATMRSNGALRSDVALTLSPGVLKVGADRPEFKLRGGNLQLKINRDGLSGNLLLRLLKQSEIRGKLELPRFNRFPAHAAQSLAGTIEVDFADFGVLPPIPHLTDLKGVADLSVDVNGSLADPRIQGLLRIRNTSANLPDFGLQLKDFNLALNTEGTMKGRNTIRLKAGLRSEEGRMEIKGDGKLELPAFTNWQARLNVRGKNLEAIDTADIRALISPDIRVRLVPGNVDVQGTLKIPEAMITPSISIGGEASATGISDDVVIVNAVTSAAEQRETSPLALTSKLKVILGDEVSLNIVDFHSHLGGSLLLIRKPGQDVFLGDGELQILNGVFKAYGQDLEIKRGRVIFADSPLDNPGLNIKAIREIRNDTGNPKVDKAGVHIQGTAQSPRITLFSEPMVAKKQILSYIVSGSALGDSQTDRSLSVGRYLSPRLYVSFGYRLLDKTKTFNIRYDMSKKWGVESTVGEEDSGVDFSYTLER